MGTAAEKWKIDLTCTDPTTVFWETTIVKHAYGTTNVQCPWHFQCSVPLALSQSSLRSILLLLKWIMVPPLLTGCQSALGWNLNFPLCCGVPLCLQILPGNGVDGSKRGHSVPLMATGQSPPALLVYVMVLCTAWCWPVGLTVTAVHLQVFFHGKKSFFVWHLLLATGQPTHASWWCRLSWGWLVMSPSSWVLHLCVLGPVHWPWAPHWAFNLGCCRFTTPFRRSGSCTRPRWWTNNSTNLLWMKYVGKFYCQFST